jgi:hypothetical protein
MGEHNCCSKTKQALQTLADCFHRGLNLKVQLDKNMA